jgi:hypothetical protein
MFIGDDVNSAVASVWTCAMLRSMNVIVGGAVAIIAVVAVTYHYMERFNEWAAERLARLRRPRASPTSA